MNVFSSTYANNMSSTHRQIWCSLSTYHMLFPYLLKFSCIQLMSFSLACLDSIIFIFLYDTSFVCFCRQFQCAYLLLVLLLCNSILHVLVMHHIFLYLKYIPYCKNYKTYLHSLYSSLVEWCTFCGVYEYFLASTGCICCCIKLKDAFDHFPKLTWAIKLHCKFNILYWNYYLLGLLK